MKKDKETILVASIIISIILGGLVLGVYKSNQTIADSGEEPLKKVSIIDLANYQNEDSYINFTGKVEALSQIELKSELSAKVVSVNYEVGDWVNSGSLIVELDHAILDTQLEKAKLGVETFDSQISASELALEQANENLKNTENLTKESLDARYDYALTLLDDIYIKSYNSYTTTKVVQETYFTGNDQEGLNVRENLAIIKLSSERIKEELDLAKSNSSETNIENALKNTEVYLNSMLSSLTKIREICDSGVYYIKVSITNKTVIDTQKAIISGAKTGTSNLIEEIGLLKIQNQNSTDIAKQRVESAKVALELQKANKEVQDSVSLAQENLNKAFIRAPFSGRISYLPYSKGDLVGMTQTIVSIVNPNALQIKAYINEKEKGLISVGSKVLLENEINGIVSRIAPAIDPITKKIEIVIAIPADQSLTIGQYVNGKININKETGSEDVYILPLSAIKMNANGSFVFVADESGIVKGISVELGDVIGDMVEVKGLSQENEILKSIRGISIEEKVEIIK